MSETRSIRRADLEDGLKFVRSGLEKRKVEKSSVGKAVLMAEETAIRLFEHAGEDASVRIRLGRSFGAVNVELSAKGEEFELIDNSMLDSSFGTNLDSSDDDGGESIIRNLLMSAFAEKLSYRYKRGRNIVSVSVVRSRYEMMYKTLTGLFLGLLCGFILRQLLPANVGETLNTNVFSTISTLFMRALQTMVGPVVFFSIASSLTGFGDISDMGKIGGKVMASYILMSFVTIMIGVGIFYLLKPGDPALAAGIASGSFTADTAALTGLSFKDMLINIIPDNIIRPFLEADMLQIIVLSVLCGVGCNLAGSYSKTIAGIFSAFNEMFLQITMMLIHVIPIVTFCSMSSLMLSIGGEAISSVLGIAGAVMLGMAALAVFYAVIILVFTHRNPLWFFKTYAPTMLQVFSLSSSNASIPLNIQVCEEKLGISPKVASFAIPLGATINMNGLCVMLPLCTLAFAKIFGVPVTGGTILHLAVTIIMLSMGAPGIPGVGIVLMSVLAEQINVPIAAVGLIIGINPVLDMFITAANCLGDVVTSFVVAKSEKLLNE